MVFIHTYNYHPSRKKKKKMKNCHCFKYLSNFATKIITSISSQKNKQPNSFNL